MTLRQSSSHFSPRGPESDSFERRRVESLRRLALRHLSVGNVDEAQRRLEEAAGAAEAAGFVSLASCLRAEALLAVGDPQSALAWVLSVLAAEPENVRARRLLADAQADITAKETGGVGLQVHLCARVGTYRQLARKLPTSADVVIELGAAEGHTTIHLARRAARVVAVEKTEQGLLRARERCKTLENVVWVCADAYDVEPVARHISGADLVYVDIGGSTPAIHAFRLASTYRRVFHPRAIVIRNVELNDFVAATATCEATARPWYWRRPVQ